jgi:hypothetical protein
MKRNRLAAYLVFFGTAGLLSGALVSAQQGPAGQPASFDRRELSGVWSLPYDGRRVPPAQLAPGVTPAMRAEAAKKDEHALRYCNLLGIPVVMDNGRPITIVQGKTQLNITAEMNVTPRYLYFRDAHVPSDVFDPSTVGDSAAHWDGDSLIVETVGLKDDLGILAIPGGGWRTERTRLIERYRLIDANTLSVTFTWIDPKIFRTPHTYEFRYTRLNSMVYVPQGFPNCNPWDPVRTAFIEGRPTPANQPLPAAGSAVQGGRAAQTPPQGRGAAGGRQGTPVAPAAGQGGGR